MTKVLLCCNVNGGLHVYERMHCKTVSQELSTKSFRLYGSVIALGVPLQYFGWMKMEAHHASLSRYRECIRVPLECLRYGWYKGNFDEKPEKLGLKHRKGFHYYDAGRCLARIQSAKGCKVIGIIASGLLIPV